MSTYATHPMSFYGKGQVNWDFIGQARQQLETHLGSSVPCLHFNGAGGNVAAGKYDSSCEYHNIHLLATSSFPVRVSVTHVCMVHLRYNDGKPERRTELAARVFAAMKTAWDDAQGRRSPVTAANSRWVTRPVSLPLSAALQDDGALLAVVEDVARPDAERLHAARNLTCVRQPARAAGAG